MKFSEAMKLLEEGKKVRVIIWDKKQYIYYNADLDEILNENGESYILGGYYLTDDWEEYIEPETKKIEKMERKNIIGALEAIDKINEIIERMNELCGEK